MNPGKIMESYKQKGVLEVEELGICIDLSEMTKEIGVDKVWAYLNEVCHKSLTAGLDADLLFAIRDVIEAWKLDVIQEPAHSRGYIS